MDSQTELGIVIFFGFFAAVVTWKIIKDFYSVKFHKVFAHLIAVTTASFMFILNMIAFYPRNYQRGVTPEVNLNITSFLMIIGMLVVIYVIFKYLPNRNK